MAEKTAVQEHEVGLPREGEHVEDSYKTAANPDDSGDVVLTLNNLSANERVRVAEDGKVLNYSSYPILCHSPPKTISYFPYRQCSCHNQAMIPKTH